MAKNITKRQEIFVAEYLTDMNAARAAIAAGYSAKSASSQASQLLSNPKVAAVIAQKTAKRCEKLDITADRVLGELARMGFANMLDYMVIEGGKIVEFDYSKLTRDQAAAIQEITMDTTGGAGDGERRLVLRTRFKLAPKTAALELLGKHLELFVERVKLDDSAGVIARLAEGRKRAANR